MEPFKMRSGKWSSNWIWPIRGSIYVNLGPYVNLCILGFYLGGDINRYHQEQLWQLMIRKSGHGHPGNQCQSSFLGSGFNLADVWWVGWCGMVKLEDDPGINIFIIPVINPHETWFKFRGILMATLDSRGFWRVGSTSSGFQRYCQLRQNGFASPDQKWVQ